MKCFLMFILLLNQCNFPDQYRETEPGGIKYTALEIYIPGTTIFTGDRIQCRVFLLKNNGLKEEVFYNSLNIIISNNNVVLDEMLYLKAMYRGKEKITFIYNEFEAGISLTIKNKPPYEFIKLNEIFYDAEGSDSGLEFIELINFSNESCDISGFKLVDGSLTSKELIIPEGIVLLSNEVLVISQDKNRFKELFNIEPAGFEFKFTLNNSGETVILSDKNGKIRDIVYIKGGCENYMSSEDWGSIDSPSAQSGNSVQRIIYSDLPVYENWIEEKPSPGL